MWLVDTIYSAGKINFESINERWRHSQLNESGEDIPLRTFHNHRKAIEQMFDINIECDNRASYLYYIENSDDLVRGGVRSWLLNTFAVNNLINESHKLKHRILFEQIPSGQQYLVPIIEAMRDGVVVEITYQGYWRDEPCTFDIEPYCVKVFRQRWYVVGRSPYYNKVKIYALDRILALAVTNYKFKIPKEFDSKAYFYNCYGIIADESIAIQTVELKVWLDKKKDKYLQALPLHHSQEVVEQTEHYVIFRYFLRPTYDFQQEILSNGADIEVCSPIWFREQIKRVITEQLKFYV